MSSKFQRLRDRYPFKHVKHDGGEFLGKNLKQHEDFSISFEQKEYAETIQCIPISKERRKENENETTAQEKTRSWGNPVAGHWK